MPENISFNAIPVDIRTPGQYIEIDHTKAVRGLPSQDRRLLLLGQRLATGSVPAGVPTQINNPDQAAAYFGRGSMLHRMVLAAKAANSTTAMWAIAVDDLEAGVAASGTLTLTGSASAAGILALYVAGQRVQVGVAQGDAAAAIATKVVNAVTAAVNLPVTAAATAGVVTFTARHKGLTGNGIDLRLNYYSDDTTPLGLTATTVAMASGAGNPDIASAVAAIGDDQYYSIVAPYTDSATLGALESMLDAKWGPMQQRTGHVFAGMVATHAALTTFGTARNSPHVSVLGIHDTPTPAWEFAASWAGVCEYYGAIDPARPFQTLPVPGLMAPPLKSRFTRTERDLLLRSGISTVIYGSDGAALIERVITTYQKNPFGVADISLLDLETKWTVDYIRYAVRARIALRFPRHKLANDGSNYAPGQAIVTPGILRAELLTLFRELEAAGLVENFDQFKNDLLVVRSNSDPNRVNAVIPPDVVNQFRVFAAAVQYLL
ncbi:tail protein [Chitiniphilus shinanonensis]|uniref:Tail protein n=1 Tax=Chitiniphilus shinanonensis TaxID=553088 RepID=A0ABQ6BV35_9NEIS|nr:phage tail sheath subtilisin-like domain-containing protein [Chitiniphilus shinanonensis]GLS03768.1 tail protein [Chitiniphilus shinanonensis]